MTAARRSTLLNDDSDYSSSSDFDHSLSDSEFLDGSTSSSDSGISSFSDAGSRRSSIISPSPSTLEEDREALEAGGSKPSKSGAPVPLLNLNKHSSGHAARSPSRSPLVGGGVLKSSNRTGRTVTTATNRTTNSTERSEGAGPGTGSVKTWRALTTARGDSLRGAAHAAAFGLLTPRQVNEYIEQFGKKDLEETTHHRGSGATDPFSFARRPSFKISKNTWLVIILVPILSWLVLFACFGIDKLTRSIAGTDFKPRDLVWTTFNPDIDQGRSVIEAILNTMSVIFGMMITVIGIILQLAASRFTSHVTQLFFKDPRIGIALSYVVFCNAFGFWVYLSIGEFYIPRASIVVSLLMVTSHLVLLFPFLAYLFFFLDPEKVVTKIMNNGLAAAAQSINEHGRDIEKQQVKATLAVEHLMDAANSALERKDKNITAEIVDALCSFTMLYGNYKDHMFLYWYDIPLWIRQSPDFLTLSDEAIEQLKERKTWMEWKILRQYQMLFNESLKKMKEMCYHISMNTRLMGEAAGRRGDLHTVDMCIKFFNTYLRASINFKDIRTVYNVLYQYRQLAEWIIAYGKEIAEADAVEENELEIRGLRVAKFLRYYASVVISQGIMFLGEVIGQDLRVICECAFENDSIMSLQVKFMDIFLTCPDGSGPGKPPIKGIRQAQVILASTYLLGVEQGFHEAQVHVDRIRKELESDSFKDLWNLKEELLNVTNREFWEVNERGTNFTYLNNEQKRCLNIFFSGFNDFTEQEDQLSEGDKRAFHKMQALQNFD